MMIKVKGITCIFILTCFLTAAVRLKMGSEDYLKYSKSVMAGARMGVSECERQFKLEPWNCDLGKTNRQLPLFARSNLPLANKETAFVHAMTTAGVMYSVIRNCSLGQLGNCRCQSERKLKKTSQTAMGWHWGGCSDNLAFGDQMARNFVDALEGRKGEGNDGRRLMNLHNNKVGRKVVKIKSKKICKCHGASSSCSVKTCMKKLSPFGEIGKALKEKYKKAIHVQFKDEALYDNEDKKVTKRKGKLVYLEASPDYCKPSKELNIPGVEGRVCENTRENDYKCDEICTTCGMKVRTKQLTRTVKCNCKFVWCCHVKCNECEEKVNTVTCVT